MMNAVRVGSGLIKRKTEVIMEGREEIVVLDAGREDQTLLGPDLICCVLSLAFYKG